MRSFIQISSLLDSVNISHVREFLLEFLLKNHRILRRHKESLDPIIIKELDKIEKDVEFDFIYIVDNFDISEFCFPFGIVSKKDEKKDINDLDLIVDQQVAYLSFFKNQRRFSDSFPVGEFLMMDEHVPELKALISNIEKAPRILNEWLEIKKIIDGISTIKEKEKYLKKRNIDQFSPLLLSLLLGFGEEKIQEFSDILKKVVHNKENLFKVCTDDVLASILLEAFQFSKQSNLTSELYDQVEIMKGKNSNDFNWFNLYIDCLAIDRICQINNYLGKEEIVNKLGKRIYFKFISSTKTSKEIFFSNDFTSRRLNGITNEIKPDLIKPVESLYLETFFDLFLSDENKGSINKLISEVNSLANFYKISSNLSFIDFEKLSTSPYDLNKGEILSNVKNIVVRLRNRIETTNLYKLNSDQNNNIRYLNGKKMFDQYINDNFFREIVTNLTVDVKKLSSLVKKRIEDIKNYKISLTYTNIIYPALAAIKENFKPFRSPKDEVLGLNHIYPTMFQSFRTGALTKSLNSLLVLIFDYKNINEAAYVLSIKELIINFELSLEDESEKVGYQQRLILNLLICFLYPFPYLRSEQDSKNIQNDLLNDLRKDVYNLQLIARKNSSYTTLYGDYVYFQIFIERYFGNYEESIVIGERYLNFDKTDPRIYHGLFLAYFTKFKKNIENDYLYLNELMHCIDLYKQCMNLYYAYDGGEIEIKNQVHQIKDYAIVAISNAEIFLNFLRIKYEYSNDYSQSIKLLEDLLLEQRKLLEDSNHLLIGRFSEYHYVKASICFYLNFCFQKLYIADNKYSLKAVESIKKALKIESDLFTFNSRDIAIQTYTRLFRQNSFFDWMKWMEEIKSNY